MYNFDFTKIHNFRHLGCTIWLKFILIPLICALADFNRLLFYLNVLCNDTVVIRCGSFFAVICCVTDHYMYAESIIISCWMLEHIYSEAVFFDVYNSKIIQLISSLLNVFYYLQWYFCVMMKSDKYFSKTIEQQIEKYV